MEKEILNKDICFLPVYINKTKLLDINSILFDGYSEFSEINYQNEDKNNSVQKGKVSVGIGMSIFSLGSQLESDRSIDNSITSNIKLKKIQTSSSLLANTIKILKNKNLLKTSPTKVGELIEFDGIFKNNSLGDFIDQIIGMTSLAKIANKLGNKDIKETDYKGLSDSMNTFKQLISLKSSQKAELVYENDDTVIVIKIDENYLYNCNLNDIYNNELTFFGQIKGIYDNYKFFSDTPLSKFNVEQLNEFIEGIKPMVNNGIYNIDFELMTSNKGKKVIEIDIIAIYRKVNQESGEQNG